MSLTLISHVFEDAAAKSEIRLAIKNGNVNRPLFVAQDVAITLGYKDPRDAIRKYCKGAPQYELVQTDGGTQRLRVITEPDMYRMVFGSTLDSAVRFQDWIFEQVLPSIRKTGEYVDADLKARISHLKSQNEALQIENEAIHDTLQSFGTSYEALHAVENSIIRNITKAPGEHKTVQLQKIVMAEVTCTEQDFWHAVTDLYNRYKIKQNEKAAWVLAR